tara:strand:+ start:1714 stop:3303 length:1590 start_codon:yes stop_codon:yes gene_type:complete
MTQSSEEYEVKYTGSAISGETFPIPFSFRHTETIKVARISAAGVSTLQTEGGSNNYTVVQKVSGGDAVSSNNRRTDYGWIVWVGTSPTDTIHIYREETLKQEYDYTNAAVIPTAEFQKSTDRLMDSLVMQAGRSDTDPSAYSMKNKEITDMGSPKWHNDLATKAELSKLSDSTATLSIPDASGSNTLWICPSAYLPSTPTVAWTAKLEVPSTSGVASTAVLSPVSSYGSAPYVEWTEPRWVRAVPADVLRYCYSYGTGTTVEGEGTSKSALWREFREMPTLPTTTDDVGKVIKLNSTTYEPEGVTADPPYAYETPNEPPSATDAARDLKMLGSRDGSMVYTPRMKLISTDATYVNNANTTVNSVAFGTRFGDADGTRTSTELPSTMCQHPFFPLLVANALVDDSGDKVMPHLVFLQVYSAASSSNIYPVFRPYLWPRTDSAAKGTDGDAKFIPDATSSTGYFADDSTANDDILVGLDLMNCNMWAAADEDGDKNTADKSHDSTYLHLTGHTATVKMLLVYGDTTDIAEF